MISCSKCRTPLTRKEIEDNPRHLVKKTEQETKIQDAWLCSICVNREMLAGWIYKQQKDR